MREKNFKVDAHGNIEYLANDIDPLCDFCCSENDAPVAALLVETREFKLADDPLRRISEGEWYACRPCLDLIRAGMRKALALRHVTEMMRKHRAELDIRQMMQLRDDTLIIHAQALDQLKDWLS